MQNWNIHQLESALQSDLMMCHTEFEKINCRAFAGMEIRKCAAEMQAEGKLTPAQLAIAQKYGF